MFNVSFAIIVLRFVKFFFYFATDFRIFKNHLVTLVSRGSFERIEAIANFVAIQKSILVSVGVGWASAKAVFLVVI